MRCGAGLVGDVVGDAIGCCLGMLGGAAEPQRLALAVLAPHLCVAAPAPAKIVARLSVAGKSGTRRIRAGPL